MISANIICKNEENFIWFSIMSVLDHVDEILIYDTGSTDNTISIIETINSRKITFEKRLMLEIKDFTKFKNEMIERSKNDWILILDADEIWSDEQLFILKENLKKIPLNNNLVRVFRREIFSKQSVSEKSNNLYAIRLIRNFTNTKFIRDFPAEILMGDNGKRKIWQLDNEYYHFHNFVRSTNDEQVCDRIQRKKCWWYQGKHEVLKNLPKVFFRNDIPLIIKQINPLFKI